MMASSDFGFGRLDHVLMSASTTWRLLAACALGGVIGLERELRHKASGLRTNMLICMGAAFFTQLSSVLAGDGNVDKGRVASNIVQGIGFLGAGLILHSKNRVLGLTSAATVWVVASIGMACGAGLFVEAAAATGILLFALVLIGLAERHARWKRYPLVYEVRGANQSTIYAAILAVLDKAGIRLNVLEHDSVAMMERVVFSITATRRRHAALLAELTASDATNHVLAFRDAEDD